METEAKYSNVNPHIFEPPIACVGGHKVDGKTPKLHDIEFDGRTCDCGRIKYIAEGCGCGNKNKELHGHPNQ